MNKALSNLYKKPPSAKSSAPVSAEQDQADLPFFIDRSGTGDADEGLPSACLPSGLTGRQARYPLLWFSIFVNKV